MRPEDLYDAFHEIDDDLLKPLPEAAPRRHPALRWGALAACALLAVPPETPLTPALLAKLLASEAGGRKCVGTRKFYVVLNQADDEAHRAAGEQTLAILKENYDVTGCLTHFEKGERV